MGEFLVVLSLYYACDAAVVHRPLSLSPPELARCMSHYEQVKAAFAAGPLAPPGTAGAEPDRRAAYAAFKAWEAKNETLVRELRERAAAAVLERG